MKFSDEYVTKEVRCDDKFGELGQLEINEFMQ